MCSTHDGIPTAADEDLEFDEGYDPCVHIIRPYLSAGTKRAVEENHPPSVWRR